MAFTSRLGLFHQPAYGGRSPISGSRFTSSTATEHLVCQDELSVAGLADVLGVKP